MTLKLSFSRRAALIAIPFTVICLAQKDPGVRGGPPGAGGPIKGLQVNELALYYEGVARVTQLEAVCDTCNDVTLGSDTGEDPNLATLTNSSGLGARFNGDQCSVCHQQPAIGGSGGFLVPNPQDPPNRFRKPENPMFDLIPHRKGAQNHVPSFITQYGPIREVRFQRKPDGTPDGGVHQLFTVVGRSDVGSSGMHGARSFPSRISKPQYRNGNLSFRIPLQLYGLGLIEAIQDATILNNSASTACVARSAGNRRHAEPERQRRHHHPLRMEGAEQVADDLCLRGVQRGNGRDQRPFPHQHGRNTGLQPRARTSPTTLRASITTDARNQALQQSAAHAAGLAGIRDLHAPTGAAPAGAVLGQRPARAATVRNRCQPIRESGASFATHRRW